MVEKNDWRLMGQEQYLKNVKLIKAKYKAPSKRWDHDHCEFCTDRFMEYEGCLREGYCTEDRKIWICEECYQDFKEMFGFTLIENKQA